MRRALTRRLRFVQISDSHIGFDKPANTDVTATLRAAIAKIKAAPEPPVLRAAHRRPDAPVEAGRVRHAAAGAVGAVAAGVLRARRARRARGRRQELPAAIRQGHAGRRLAQLRSGRRALHRPRQRRQPEGRRARHARRRAARMARAGRQAPQEQHADRRVRAHSALVGVSGMGLGHRRQRAGAVVSEAVRLGVGAERPHPSGDAEGRRARHVPHGDVDRVPAAGARHRAVARTDEGGGRPAAEGARPVADVVPRRQPSDRDHRRAARSGRDDGWRAHEVVGGQLQLRAGERLPSPSARRSRGPTATTCRTTSSAPTSKFKSPVLDTDEQFSYRFDRAGHVSATSARSTRR